MHCYLYCRNFSQPDFVKHQDHNTAGLSDQCEADIVRIIVEASKRELNRPIKKKRTDRFSYSENV